MKIKNLTVSFDGKTVLDNVNLELPKGIYAIMAPSGRGKTTLLRAIAGLIDYSGTIEGQGKTAMLFQDDRLLPWLTVKQNATLVASDEAQADYFLQRLGIAEEKNAGINTLSGGMQRRVSIAQMLCYGGDTYLLDEPTRGLDDVNAQAVMRLILENTVGKTVIFATHSLEEAQKYADKIIHL